MKKKKVRNHSRIQKQITLWKDHHIKYGPKYSHSKNTEYTYANTRIYPYVNFTLNNSIPAPIKGKTRQLFIEAFLEIFEAWELQAKAIGNDYYLKIWLYEPYFENSEIVYTTGNRAGHYENMFREHEKELQFPLQNFGSLAEEMAALSWSAHLDEQHIFDTDKGKPEDFATVEDYNENLKWFNQMMKKSHKTDVYEQENGTTINVYSFRKGIVWIGE